MTEWLYMADNLYVRRLRGREWEAVQVLMVSPLRVVVCHRAVDLDDCTRAELDYACRRCVGRPLTKGIPDYFLAYYMMRLDINDHWEDWVIYESPLESHACEFARRFRDDQRSVE